MKSNYRLEVATSVWFKLKPELFFLSEFYEWKICN